MKKHDPIFNTKTINEKTNSFNISSISDFSQKLKIINNWKYSIDNSDLNKTKEKNLQGKFLLDFFVGILGYETQIGNSNWSFIQEFKTNADGTTPDGVLGYFEQNKKNVSVVIELKDAVTDLDQKQKSRENKLSPVEQAFSYAPKFGSKCKWIIVSNFKEIRLYNASNSLSYETFIISDLGDEEEFKKFYYLLNAENLISKTSKSQIDQIYEKLIEQEKNISKEFYQEYKKARVELFSGLVENNIEINQFLLIEKTQKLMDRLIFIYFCEDQGLLPSNTFRSVIENARKSFDPSDTKAWGELKGLFKSIDKGNPHMSINRYNGGLFALDDVLDNLRIPDYLLDGIDKLANYDFATDLNVNILGHIFEQSISDIEEIKSELSLTNNKESIGKRKKDGIFYTPDFVTNFIVSQCIGAWLEEKRKEIGEDSLPELAEINTKKISKADKNKINIHITYWKKYVNILSDIKILDPACGSGAFLIAAFDYLYKEGQRANDELSKIDNGQVYMFNLNESILKNNLYGVDLNQESVEITKLSLWLKTANKNDSLTSLDDNILCGNSLIDDSKYVGEKAFNWNEHFAEIINNGGFDIIIGNPPYVRQELLGTQKAYFKEHYKVYNGSGDLFAYFYEKSIDLLNKNGIMGFISNAFSKTSAGLELRNFLKHNTRFMSYTDFTDLQIFDGATTYPVILIMDKKKNSKDEFKYFKVKLESLSNLSGYLTNNSIMLNQRNLDDNNWSFKSDGVKNLIQKIKKYPNMRDVFGKCYYGIKTGLNEAFIVTEDEKNFFINDSPKTIEFFKPFLEGKDLKKWSVERPYKWLLLFPKGWTKKIMGEDVDEVDGWDYIQQHYSKIAEHLIKYDEAGKNRCDKGDFWWELRACGYYNLFDNEKIVWPNLQSSNKFTYDDESYYINAPSVILPSNNKTLLCILNSRLTWFFLKDICVVRSGGFLEAKPKYLELLPIALPENENEINQITNKVLELNIQISKKIAEFNTYIKSMYKPQKITDKMKNFYLLEFDIFINEFKKQKVILSETKKFELMGLFNDVKSKIVQDKNQLSVLENEIDQLVYNLYELTEEEINIIEVAVQ